MQQFDAGSPPDSGKWQICTGGGSQPAWRAAGREFFYLSADNILMASSVKPGDTFNYDRPVPLFDIEVSILRGPRNDYATRDGNSFLVTEPAYKGQQFAG